MKKNKKQTAILFAIVGLVITIALLIPYTTDNDESGKSDVVDVGVLSCDNDNPNSEHDTTLSKISCEDYNNIINGNEKQLVLYARPTCGYCNKFVPVLEEIVSEYNVKLNYFDIDILSEAETQEFYSSSPLMSGSEFGTPTLAIIKNGKIEAYSIGYKEKDAAVEWLEGNGIISK